MEIVSSKMALRKSIVNRWNEVGQRHSVRQQEIEREEEFNNLIIMSFA